MTEQTFCRMCYLYEIKFSYVSWLGHETHQGPCQKIDFAQHLSTSQLTALQVSFFFYFNLSSPSIFKTIKGCPQNWNLVYKQRLLQRRKWGRPEVVMPAGWQAVGPVKLCKVLAENRKRRVRESQNNENQEVAYPSGLLPKICIRRRAAPRPRAMCTPCLTLGSCQLEAWDHTFWKS